MIKTAIIMAGGSGERFWPLSRKTHPKQLLKLVNPTKTMLEEAIERISPVVSPDNIFIITGEHLLNPIRNAMPNFPPQNIIAEPAKRNTAPCLALGAACIKAKYSNIPNEEILIAVLTADHIIEPQNSFIETIATAFKNAENAGTLGTIGVIPTRPETGYGYIETEHIIDDTNKNSTQNVISFREKPTSSKAQEYVLSGRFLWNSGMFFWRLDTFIDEMKLHLAEVGNKITELSEAYINNINNVLETSLPDIDDLFSQFPNISIDFGLMEKSQKVAVTPALFNWDDCGSWDSMERIREKDSSGNIIQGETILLNSNNNIFINAIESKGFLLTGYGLHDLTIIITDDAAVVCPKDKVQEVKSIVENLKNNNKNIWL